MLQYVNKIILEEAKINIMQMNADRKISRNGGSKIYARFPNHNRFVNNRIEIYQQTQLATVKVVRT
jgi:hypothetical protein